MTRRNASGDIAARPAAREIRQRCVIRSDDAREIRRI